MADFTSSLELLTSGNDGELGSRFPVLVSLKFAHIHAPSPDVLDRFFGSLTGLKRLHLIFPRVAYDDEMPLLHYLLPFASEAIRRGHGRPALPHEIVCPVLEELTIAGRQTEALLQEFANFRKSFGCPLKRIFYDPRDGNPGNSELVFMPSETEAHEYQESDASLTDTDDEEVDEDDDWNDDWDGADEEDGWTDEDQVF
ncbi:hypothetical protein FRB90_007557 [Tulasnella sp. 427]|nr:hypothetical protein FRB90_007557 [Tulasnella sp. 427]